MDSPLEIAGSFLAVSADQIVNELARKTAIIREGQDATLLVRLVLLIGVGAGFVIIFRQGEKAHAIRKRLLEIEEETIKIRRIHLHMSIQADYQQSHPGDPKPPPISTSLSNHVDELSKKAKKPTQRKEGIEY